MRVLEFITEDWWEGLDDTTLTMMGYVVEPEPVEINQNQDIKAIARSIDREKNL